MDTMMALNRFPRMMQEYRVARVRGNYRANHFVLETDPADGAPR